MNSKALEIQEIAATLYGKQPCAVTIADPQQQDCPLIYVNPSFENLTLYSSEFALGRNCRFLQGEDSDPDVITEIRESISQERGGSFILRNYRKDGTAFNNFLLLFNVKHTAGGHYIFGFQYEFRMSASRMSFITQMKKAGYLLNEYDERRVKLQEKLTESYEYQSRFLFRKLEKYGWLDFSK